MSKDTSSIATWYALARERYAAVGVDTERALERLDRVPISMQCWQGDDVRGFENPQGALTGDNAKQFRARRREYERRIEAEAEATRGVVQLR